MSQVKSITTRSSILFIGKIVDAFFMFIFNFLAAKYVGATGYGTYVYLSALILFLSIAIKMGMDHGLTAMLPSYEDLKVKKQLVTMSILILFFLSIVVVIVFGLGSHFVSSVLMNNAALEKPLLVFLPMVFFIAFVQLSEGIFRSIGGIKHFFFSKNILMPIVLVVSFVLANMYFGESTLYQLIAVNYLAWTVNVLYIVVILFKRKVFILPSFDNKELFGKFILISLPLILVGLLEFLMGRTDAYVIGYKLTEADVGVYSIVDKLAYIGNFMFITAGSMMTPVLAAHYAKKDFVNLKETYLSINKWILIVNTLVFFGIFLLGDIVLGLFGGEFNAGILPLYLLALAQLINAIFGPLAYMFAMVGLEKREWHIGVAMLIINLVLDILVAPWAGILGIALVTVLVYTLGNLSRVILLWQKHRINVFSMKGFLTVVLGILAYGITFILRSVLTFSNSLVEFVILGFILVIVYGVLVYTMNLSHDEKTVVKAQSHEWLSKLRGKSK